MRSYVVQSSFLSGVLDPRASGRIETDAYNQGLLVGTNIEPVHLGGVRVRRGLAINRRLPNKITRVTSGVTPTAPNGGTAANANDGSESTAVTTTNTVGTTNPFVVVQYDLGVATTVRFADVIGISSDGGASTQFLIQYSNDASSWTNYTDLAFANFQSVDTTPRSYRRAADFSSPISARYWRVARVGSADMGAVHITLKEFNLWADTGEVSEVRLIPFEVSTEDRYVVALTDFSATVIKDGVLVGHAPTPYASADLADIDAATNAETMVVVDEDYAPRFFLREGADNFQCEQIAFTTVPTTDFADSLSPTPVSDVQVITFSSGWTQGSTFQVELEGARTAAIVFAGDATAAEQSSTAANIAREVQKLYTVEGFDGVTCARTGALTYTVTFAAGSAKNYELMNVVTLSSAAAAVVAKSANGSARTEPVWSATRGYPRTVTFYEGRLYFGGTRSRQQSVLASAVNNILDFEILEGLDGDAIFTTLNGQALNAISGLFAGRSLQLFTTGGEFRYVKAQGVPITPSDAPVAQTFNGAAKVRPVSIDGATLYVQRTRKAIRDFRFNYEEDSFDSLGVSSLSSHLINDVVDLAAWNGSRTDEIGLVFVVNGDGTVAVFNSRKEANVQAWTRWTTGPNPDDEDDERRDQFKAVAVVLEDIYFAVQRTLGGVTTLFLEKADDTYRTDCAKKFENSPASTAITGLAHFNGEEIRVVADGFVLENVTPSGGNAAISRASEDVEAGLDYNPTVTPMPLNTMSRAGPNFMFKRRVVKVRVKVRNTLGLRMNGRVLPDRKFDVDMFDQAPEPYSGVHVIEETSNWDETEEKLVTFDQVDPLPMEILAIVVHLEGVE